MAGIYNNSYEDRFREAQLNDYLRQSEKEEYKEPEVQVSIPEWLYFKLEEYFDNKADADLRGDRIIPNEEIKLRNALNYAYENRNK